MSALLEFTNRPEQPRVPLPYTHLPITTWPSEQPTEQPRPPRLVGPLLRRGKGIAGWVLEHGKSLLVPDVDKDPRHAKEVPGAVGFHVKSILCSPLRQGDRIIGVVQVLKRMGPTGPAFSEEDIPHWQRLKPEVPPDSALKGLEDAYVIDDRSAVAAFIEQNRLRGLLVQAREPLNAAFGEAAVKTLTLIDDDEGFNTLFCLIVVSGDMHEARLALGSFDQRWWLARSDQAAGKLNFDFELV